MNTSTHPPKRITRTSSKTNKQTKEESYNSNKSSTKPPNNKKTNNNNSSSPIKTTATKQKSHKGKGTSKNSDRSPIRTRSNNTIQTTVKNLFNSPSIYSNGKKSIQNNINNITSSIQTFNVDTIGITQETTKETSSPIAKAIKWTQNKFSTSGIESEDESQASNKESNKAEEEIRFKSSLKAPPLLQDLEMAASTSPSTSASTPSQSISITSEIEINDDHKESPASNINTTPNKTTKNQQISPATTESTVTSPPHKKPNNNNSPSNVSMTSINSTREFNTNKNNNNITKASHTFAEVLNKAHSAYNHQSEEIPSIKQRITTEELKSIEDGEFITDPIINFWSEWLGNNYPAAKNCHFCSSLLFTKLQETGYDSVKTWDKNIAMETKDIIFIPINNIQRFHWYLVVVVPGKFITILDSFQKSQTKKEIKTVCNLVYQWLNGKGIKSNKTNLPLHILQPTPQQANGYDCGIYVCKFMQCTIAQLQFDGPITLIKNKFFNINPSDITSLRQCIQEKLIYSKKKQNEITSMEQNTHKEIKKEETDQEQNQPNTPTNQATKLVQQTTESINHNQSENEDSDSSGQSEGTRSTRIPTNQARNPINITPTEEDDINTTASGETTTYRRSEMDTEQPPDSFRYRLILPMPKTPAEAVARQQNGQNLAPHETDPFLRLRELLVKFYSHIRAIDNTLLLMKWSSKVIETVLVPEQLPTDPVQLSEYFEGYNPKTEEGKRQFFRVRIASTAQKKNVIATGKAFAAPHGGSFNILSVNVEESTEIGYLIYSSRYTDTEHISKFLEKKTKFPWGFAYKQLYASDPESDWRKRVRVQTIHVPAEKKELAIATVQNIFKITSSIQPEFPQFTQKYLYAAAEHEHDQFPDEASIQNQKVMMDRHRIHFNALEAKFTTSISGSIDRMINTRTGKKASMRQLILSIKSTREGPLKGTPLFHAVDFIADSKDVTFQKNKKGPGGPGHIFSYYEAHRSEAVAMVRGLGVYIGKIFGKKATYRYFNADHWKVNDGWRWSVSQKKFITIEANQIQQNVQYDYNAAVLLIESDIQEERNEDTSISNTTDIGTNPQLIRGNQVENRNRSTHNNQHHARSTQPDITIITQTTGSDQEEDNRQDTTVLGTVLETRSEDGTSEASTEMNMHTQLQIDLVQAQIDPDAQSMGNEDDKENPTAIHISDNDSTTSSLTWNRSIGSIHDDNSTIASQSINSISTASAATIPSNDTSLKSITNTQNMEDMYDPTISSEENIKHYENYIAANTKKAQEVARKNYIAICKYKSAKAHPNSLSKPLQTITTSATLQHDDKSEKSSTSSVELENLLSTPLDTIEQTPTKPTGSENAGSQS
jgi:Ulp1 family protease